MTNEIPNDVTITSVENMIHGAISEVRYSFSKRPDECRILNYIKEILDGDTIDKIGKD